MAQEGSFIYSPDYYCDIGPHIFPVAKYRMVRDQLLSEAGVRAELFLTPEPAARDELLLVHTREYLDDLFRLRWTERTRRSELPISREIVRAFVLAAGGTILGARQAIANALAFNLTGGFHHAFADHAEGFCYLNDIAVAVRVVQREKLVQRVLVLDLDLHQGNGTARIFAGDPSVFTFSMHQENNYPVKEKSNLDIGLPDHTGNAEYLAALRKCLPEVLAAHRPQLVLYQAGADPYEGDQLGGLSLTVGGLQERDRYVVSQCRGAGAALCGVLGGGYAFRTEDTLRIHTNTCLTFLRAARDAP
jgi:acetoin utilization deacetylase AcuC-like enzyme